MFPERRAGDRRQATRSGRRATDPQPHDSLADRPAPDDAALTPIEKAIAITRRDVAIQSRQIAALRAEIDAMKAAIRRLTDMVQILTAPRPANPPPPER